ncbi:MAG: hypothetical protein KBE09_03735, partial [Candidatus Pacebacteria bacterium]|nr:hypothetical protein [Candidatus Paceibacterota bacterium]
KKLKPEVIGRLRKLLTGAPESVAFSDHSGPCTPWNPCVACQGAALIRENLVAESIRELGEKLRALDNPAEPTTPVESPETNDEYLARKLATPWKEVLKDHISRRSYGALEATSEVVTLGDLVRCTEAEMLTTPNFGRKCLNELKEVLADQGLHFGWQG